MRLLPYVRAAVGELSDLADIAKHYRKPVGYAALGLGVFELAAAQFTEQYGGVRYNSLADQLTHVGVRSAAGGLALVLQHCFMQMNLQGNLIDFIFRERKQKEELIKDD